MIIKSVELLNFRNYETMKMVFSPTTNIIYGDNAQGKTNILEACYLSGTSKSHKGSYDREMIRFGESESHIRTLVEKQGREIQIDLHLKKNKTKGIAINRVPIKKVNELFEDIVDSKRVLREITLLRFMKNKFIVELLPPLLSSFLYI